MNVGITDLFDLEHTLAADWLRSFTYPWEALGSIKDIILAIGATLNPDEYDQPAEHVWIAKSAHVFSSAYIAAPCIIGARTEVRHCAFIRGSALVGEDCVVGNSTELKNVILFDHVQVPHYNYVGDSILGHKAHMGAGSITSNIKNDKAPITVRNFLQADEEQVFDTGIKKIGALIADHVEVGCNSVLNPGTVIGRNTNVYPLSLVRGIIPANSIVKSGSKVVQKR